MIRCLDLFSGIGGFALGLHWAGGFDTVQFCEVDPFCRSVLAERFPGVPCHEDIHTLDSDDVVRRVGAIDLICGGFPCQPHSVSGKRQGKADPRHLWPEMARIIRGIRPRWVLAENVPGIRTTAIDEVLGDMEAAGYSAWPLVVGARHVGAEHERKRVWIVGYANEWRAARDPEEFQAGQPEPCTTSDVGYATCTRNGAVSVRPRRQDEAPGNVDGPSARMVNATCSGCGTRPGDTVGNDPSPRGERASEPRRAGPDLASVGRWPSGPGGRQHDWEAPRVTQSGLGESIDGLSRRVASRRRKERLKALGNAVVPQVVCQFGRAILQVESIINPSEAA